MSAEKIIIPVRFRWPVNQISQNEVEVVIERGPGFSVINPQFVDDLSLCEREYRLAEQAALEALVVVR